MATVTIAGLSGSVTVDVEDGATLAEALEEAGQSVSGGLSAAVNGSPVESADVTLSNGDTVTLTPPNVKLG